MRTYRIGATHENDLGPPEPMEIVRKPDESADDLGARIMKGVKLETWAVITHGTKWMDVHPVPSAEAGHEKVRAAIEFDAERRVMYPNERSHYFTYAVEYLRATSVSVSVNFEAVTPPEATPSLPPEPA